jgi:hypothetical protein
MTRAGQRLTTRAAVLLLGCVMALPAARAQRADAAYRFILDYDVPESPAFAVLGVTPANVLRASAAKPVVASLLNQLARGERVAPGIALDFSPYLVYGGGFRSYKDYAGNTRGQILRRLLANTVVSIGTVEGETDDAPLQYGAGVRINLYDNRSLLQNRVLADSVSRLLAQAAEDPGTEIGPDPQPTRQTVDLSAAYTRAREAGRRTAGLAAALGFGSAGALQGSVASADSAITTANRAWFAASYSSTRGYEGLATAQWIDGPDIDRRWLLGAAVRANTAVVSFAAEAAYDTEAGFQPGASAEIRLVRRVTLVAALVTMPDPERGDVKRLRARTSLQWNLSETQ